MTDYEKGYRQAILDAIQIVSEHGTVWMVWSDGMSKEEVAKEALESTKMCVIDMLNDMVDEEVSE